MGVSRDRLCAMAITDYVRRLEAKGLTGRIDRALRRQDSKLDTIVARMQFSSLEKDEW